MQKHYVKKQDGSVIIINAKNPAPFMEDTDVLLSVDPENLPDKADRAHWIENNGTVEVDSAAKLTQERNDKLEEIREHRAPLLSEADVEINKLEDAAGDPASWRTYRSALRDITESYKADMSTLDAVADVAADVTWPAKPE